MNQAEAKKKAGIVGAALFEQDKADGATRLDPEIARLSDRLSVLETDIKLLRDARSLLIHEAFGKDRS